MKKCLISALFLFLSLTDTCYSEFKYNLMVNPAIASMDNYFTPFSYGGQLEVSFSGNHIFDCSIEKSYHITSSDPTIEKIDGDIYKVELGFSPVIFDLKRKRYIHLNMGYIYNYRNIHYFYNRPFEGVVEYRHLNEKSHVAAVGLMGSKGIYDILEFSHKLKANIFFDALILVKEQSDDIKDNYGCRAGFLCGLGYFQYGLEMGKFPLSGSYLKAEAGFLF